MRIVLLLVLVACQSGAEASFIAAAGDNGPTRLSCLMKFIRWPDDTRQGPFLVGIVGLDGGESFLREVRESPTFLGRPVQILVVRGVEDMKRCHIVYLGRMLGSRVRQILPQLAGAGVLTVAAIPGFGQMGGMVELIPRSKVQQGSGIVLNAEAARSSGFTFHAGLLTVVSIARTQGYTE